MNAWALWNPGDQVLIWGLNVLLQISLVTAISLVVAKSVRRNPAVRYWVLCSTLFLVLLSPAIALVMQLSGTSLLSVSLMHESVASASDVTAVELPVERQTVEAALPFSALMDFTDTPTADALDPFGADHSGRNYEQPEDSRAAIEVTSAPPPPEPTAVHEAGTAALPATEQTATWIGTILRVAMPPFLFIWLTGAAVFLTRLALGWCRIAAILRSARPNTDALLAESFQQVARVFQVTCMPELVLSKQLAGPVAAGLFRPRVVLPERMVDRVTPRQLRDILVHELAHIVRRDQMVVLPQNLASAIFWLHPLVKALNRQLAQAREDVCDNYVLAATDAPSYSRTLLRIAELVQTARPCPGAVGLFTSRWKLERRVASLLDERRNRMVRLTAQAKTLVVALSVVMATIATLGTMRLAVGQTGKNPSTTDADPFSTEEATAQDNSVQVTGVVLKPDGIPAAGATVRAALAVWATIKGYLGEDYETPMSVVTTDQQGRFTILVHTRPYGDVSKLDARWSQQWRETRIAATLDGYGPAWAVYNEIDADQPIRLQLVDDMPIRGRVIDLEGAPIAGTSVRIDEVRAAEDEDLSSWFASIKAGEPPWTAYKQAPRYIGTRLIGIPDRVTTANDGSFEIRGIGRERITNLAFVGESVAHRSVGVVARKMQSIERVILPPRNATEPIFGAEFAFTAAPARPIEGIVIDAKTRKPLTGVRIESYKLADYPYAGHAVVETTTDEEGQFRLVGMPKGEGNMMMAVPDDEQPYFMRKVTVPDPAGIEPVSLTIELHRGIWITGRVTDGVTGEPVPSVRMHYLPFRSNKFAQAIPEFDDDGNTDGDQTRYVTKSDGTYRLVGLHGRAVVGAESILKSYRYGVGYHAIDAPKEGKTDWLLTYRNPINPSPKWPSVMHEINPVEGVDKIELDLELDPGGSIRIRILGEFDELVRGTDIHGLRPHGYLRKYDEPVQTAVNFGPDETRSIVFLHQDRNIGRVISVGPQQVARGELTVNLLPCATVTGQLLNKDEPLSGLVVEPRVLPGGDFSKRLPPATTDADGHFRCTVIPGCRYTLTAQGKDIQFATVIDDFAIEPGETKNLGTLTFGENRRFVAVPRDESTVTGPVSTKVEAKSDAEAETTIRGRVVGPNGEPMRAQLWLGGPPRLHTWGPTPQTVDWTPVSQVGDDGVFQVTLDNGDLGSAPQTNPRAKIRLAATSDGFGFAWADVDVGRPRNDVTLQLVEDVPIEGRIITAEGQPARGAKISISQVYSETKLNVAELVKQAPLSSGVYTNWPSWPGGGPTSKPLVTNADGRFRLPGMGAGRFVRLEVFGPGIGATRLGIVTHAPPASAVAGGVIAVREGLAESTYFARFTHIAAPGRTIRGVVTDAATGSPLPGVLVTVNSSWTSRKSPATTGEDGQYEITGIPKSKEYWLELKPTKSLHFNKKLKLIDPPGLEPIDVNCALMKGLRVRGRVTDKESGEAARGMVIYNPLFPNDHVSELGEQAEIAKPASSTSINEDGSFEISVLPGPGALAVETVGRSYVSAMVDADRLREIVGEQHVRAEEINGDEVRFLTTAAGGQARGVMGINRYQGVVLVNPPEHSDGMTVDFKVIASQSRPGTIVDEQGMPLGGVQVIGLGASGITATVEPLESADFEVEGLVPGRPRTLLFLHRERELGAKLVVTGDDMTLIRTKLSPTGTITGRFVDQFGAPLPRVHVYLTPADPRLSVPEFWEATVDENGRFRITGLIEGSSYRLDARIPEKRVTLFVRSNVNAAPGDTVDLGEFTQQDEYRFMAVRRSDSDESGGVNE